MLLTYSGYYTYRRMHKIADFLYVTWLFGTHFHYKHLIIRLQVFTHRAYNSHCSVETAGCHHRGKMLLQNPVKVMLG